jgi:hypothetical protein
MVEPPPAVPTSSEPVPQAMSATTTEAHSAAATVRRLARLAEGMLEMDMMAFTYGVRLSRNPRAIVG